MPRTLPRATRQETLVLAVERAKRDRTAVAGRTYLDNLDPSYLRFFYAHYPAAYGVDRTAGTNAIRQQLDNLNDAGKIWIETALGGLTPGTTYEVTFRLAISGNDTSRVFDISEGLTVTASTASGLVRSREASA